MEPFVGVEPLSEAEIEAFYTARRDAHAESFSVARLLEQRERMFVTILKLRDENKALKKPESGAIPYVVLEG